MKKLLSVLLAALLLATAIPLSTVSVGAATTGTYGYLTYEIVDGKVTITECDTSVSGRVNIPSTIEGYPVIVIGEMAFLNCSNMTSVVIPESVITIADYAFYGCTSLIGVAFYDGVTIIGNGAFAWCRSLRTVIIPDTVAVIGSHAFTYCTAMNSVYIGKGVTAIGESAFRNCVSLTSVSIPEGVKAIESSTFYACESLRTVYLPVSVSKIDIDAFRYCHALTDVYYKGTEEDRKNLYISNSGNSIFTSGTTWHYHEHKYDSDCDADCNTCGAEREPMHDLRYLAAVAPTCTQYGNLECWHCNRCFGKWLDEDLTVSIDTFWLDPTGHDMNVVDDACKRYCSKCGCYFGPYHDYDNEYDADCNECGNIREVPEKPIEVVYGDANGDGSVNARDAATLQQYVAGWDVSLTEASADANGDGSVNARDAAVLQQYVAGWDVTLGT